MSRVLVTGGAGGIGAAVVKRLLADPAYEVRVSDQRPAPRWMREGCEVRTGDLRRPGEAAAATVGCTQVIHLSVGAEDAGSSPHTVLELNRARDDAVIRAAVALGVERLVYLSSSLVFERAELFPTPEDYLPQCPTPLSVDGFSKLAGEISCRAAHDEHGLAYTICRPFDPYGLVGPEEGEVAGAIHGLILQALTGRSALEISGSGARTRTPTHIEDLAEGLVVAMSSPAALNEDFNISADRELALADIARAVWDECGRDPEHFALEHVPALATEVKRRRPSVEKARTLLGWEARIGVEDGIAATVRWLRERQAAA
ncbi:MAG TPA: NAD(P)-dependent oxidoreductase [Solirubrobacteraceae bacterium]|nr:NAD(P)-dependent oxidoreductase [Solirubrobacteraceae bacterium]